ncbi:response regulator transcription factor [Nocardioides mangrovi]|uniref:Response regulator transcription factor n=1 Tax=Nocardioides mangrovi TaxID=2874580 RepID=A0ABS7UFF3_9ACTN|nr:response regulator transcription factor [Nocardioides mangrovi]MBZ5739729.1 response regulator transcription factor [Nocardioides mangrovi]
MTPDLAVDAPLATLVRADHADLPATTPTAWIVLSAEQPLLAESLRLALVRRGLDTLVVPWPDEPAELAPGRLLAPARPGGVGVALVEMASEAELDGIGALVERVPVRWLLLAHRGPNPLWGAAFDRGVDIVLPTTTDLDALVDLVGRAARGEQLLDERRADALRAVWHDVLAMDTLRSRVRSLSARETQVLRLLYGGTGVHEIAVELGVSDSTVRTHVAAVLRKLGVASQLRAVAVYDEYLDRTGR